MYWIRAVAGAAFLVPVLWTAGFELLQDTPFDDPADWLGIVIPIFFAVFTLPVVWVLTSRAHHTWQFRDAPIVAATLTSASATGTSGSGTEQFELRADVFPEGRSSFRGVMVEFVNLGELPLLVPGAELDVAHLPDGRIKLRKIHPRPLPQGSGTAAKPTPSRPEADQP